MENKQTIINTFIRDTHVCAVHGLQLMKYQTEKYNWSLDTWNEYYQIYRFALIDLDTKPILNSKDQIKISNTEVKALQKGLHDIIHNIEANIEVINNYKITDIFMEPIAKFAAEISDKIYVQTKDTVNEINL